MKKTIRIFAIVLCALAIVSCASTTKVSRVQTGTAQELSGQWNERDVDIVCRSLLGDMFQSGRYRQYASSLDGRLPLIRVGQFRNESDEHIETAIVTTRMQNEIFNSGLADFVVLHRTCHLDLPSEKQKLLGKRCFSRVRV